MQRELESLLREQGDAGRTVFLSSRRLDEVRRSADQIGIIEEGRLVAENTVEGLRRAAPQKMGVCFRHPMGPADLKAPTGVTSPPGKAGA